jgi:superfamily II DNA or RNA helicase
MLDSLEDFTAGLRFSGVVADDVVTIVAVEFHGEASATVTYRGSQGRLGECVMTSNDLATVSCVADRRWTFDADGALFRLASEARRMKWAHLADPFAAIDTSNIEPYPHQIDAVYNRFLEQKPLRFLLADDPGAGKTIMSGLLIRELMLRGDVARCLIVAPGSLVEQWQDEMWDRFGMSFDLLSRAKVEESRSGNPFLERNLMVARIDQLSRSDELKAKLQQSDWDLIIVDEAHKMSARMDANGLDKTKRFELGEVLRDHTRHFLLLSATPHNGKNDDFMAFMTLIDPDQFGGRLRGDHVPDVSNVMRRLVKEKLTTFDGKPIFPKRYAHTLGFKLSSLEQALYDAVTDYVQNGMNRADQLTAGGDKRRGLIVGFALAGLQRRLASSPAAIYHSLRRRFERLTEQANDLRTAANVRAGDRLAAAAEVISAAAQPDFDPEDYDEDEFEEIEDTAIDAATAAASLQELEAELVDIANLVKLADEVRRSGLDTKWVQLRDLLRSEEFKNVDPPRKLIVFSEHRDTLNYVAERIRNELGDSEAIVSIHGGIRRDERRQIQDRFRVDPNVRVLVATDAAGEGVNLQVANLMVNYDLPWNPNRIEQRFGRIHRIGQRLPCHLWNLLAYETREGRVFQMLFEKIDQQRSVYGDQVYDVLGDSMINVRLQELLLRAIREDSDAIRNRDMDRVIEHEIGQQLIDVLNERALVDNLGAEASTDEIRDLMERSKARRLQPWFVESFFTAALTQYGGRIVGRESDRFEVTRVPAAIRGAADPALAHVHDRYGRVTFDKRAVQRDAQVRAELISPGSALLTAVVNKVLSDHGSTMASGATLVDPTDMGTEPRLLVYLDHAITDGRYVNGNRQVVSRRFQYVEIDRKGVISHPGSEPYIGYGALTDEQLRLVHEKVDTSWANQIAEASARSWAIEHFAHPHLAEISTVIKQRVGKVREAVRDRLVSEIRYWDKRTEEIKQLELTGKKSPLNSGLARSRADNLEARLARRRVELDQEENLHNEPPTIVGAALIVPQGLLDHLAGQPSALTMSPDTAETDRRAVAAVMAAEVALGRIPTEQAHNKPGFDIESVDPTAGTHYFIEVKGHLPQTTEVKVSAQQVQKAKSNPERWRLAIASVPIDPGEDPLVRYLVDPFRDTHLHFAQTHVPLNVADLLQQAGKPS